MKNILFIVLILATTFTACEKCTDCKCVSEISYDFQGYTAAEQSAIKTATDAGYANQYPDEEKEVCARRGKPFSEAVETYENKSVIDNQSFPAIGGKSYSYEYVRQCTCLE